MNPTEFICGLMRENTDAVGFIPRPTVLKEFILKDRYILQVNRFGKVVGYLLHGPTRPDRHMKIHQACIRLDKRNHGFGVAAVRTLFARALKRQALTITLHCADELEATLFWCKCGFVPIDYRPGGKRRRRAIITFRADLTNTVGSTPSIANAIP